jgi:hypothetical protein
MDACDMKHGKLMSDLTLPAFGCNKGWVHLTLQTMEKLKYLVVSMTCFERASELVRKQNHSDAHRS